MEARLAIFVFQQLVRLFDVLNLLAHLLDQDLHVHRGARRLGVL